MRKLGLLLPAMLSAFLLLLAGCGGDGGAAGGGNAAAYAGTYAGGYNRATGTMLINVDASGTVSIVVNDDPEGVFTGTGSVNASNGFTVPCTGPGGRTVNVVGSLAGTGAGRTATGNVSGTFSVAYTANFATDSNHSVFAGHYEGFFNGADNGTWMADVDSTGRLTGSAFSNGYGLFNVTGQITATGAATITGNVTGTSATATFTGRFLLVTGGVRCNGSWTSSLGGNGAWEGGNSNEG